MLGIRGRQKEIESKRVIKKNGRKEGADWDLKINGIKFCLKCKAQNSLRARQ